MFRRFAILLAVIALIEIVGILMTPTYEVELAQAKAAYYKAEAEYNTLQQLIKEEVTP